MSTKKGKGKRSTVKAVERTVLHKVIEFVAPHLIGTTILLFGLLAHVMWGDQGSPFWARAYVPILLLGAFVGLSYVAWRYSAARPIFQRYHVTGSTAWAGLCIVLLDVLGPKIPLIQLILVSWLFLALAFNVRRLTVVRGDGDEKEQEREDEIFGIKRPTRMQITDESPNATITKVRLAPGDIADQVTKVSRKLGSRSGTIPNGVRVIESENVEGELELKFIWKDLLKESFNWTGPRFVGGSILDPIYIGVNEESQEVSFVNGPQYIDGEFIPPSHLKIGGRPRSGKGVLVLMLVPEYCSRVEVFPMVSDHAKGEQMLGMLRPGLPRERSWINTTIPGIRTQAQAVLRAMRARNAVLGKHGYSSWRPEAFHDPRLRMPALVWFIEEFTSAVRANPQLFTDIANEALSAGIYLVASMQRVSHAEMPTSMRSAMASGICFKTEDDIDDGFVLSDETLSTGTRPSAWGERTAGRAMCSLAGASDRMNKVPFKVYFANSLEEFESYIPEVMGALRNLRPELDPVTRSAFGDAFEEYVSGGGTDPESGSGAAPESGATQPTTRPAPKTETGMYDPNSEILNDNDDPEEGGAVFSKDEIPGDDEYVVPASPEPIISAGMNPREPLPTYRNGNLDLTEGMPKSTKKYSRQEKEQIFHGLMIEFAGLTVETSTVVDRWCELLGFPEAEQRATVNDFLQAARKEGRITRLKRGLWVFPARTHAHAASPVNGRSR
jgi:hypothetical protein